MRERVIAVVGLGPWGRTVVAALQRVGRGRVVAAEEDPARREGAPCPTAASLDALLEAHDPPLAVVVATPSHGHAAVARRALDAGCDVLVEKPLALSGRDAAALAATARAHTRILQAGHLLEFDPLVRAFADTVGSGALGPLRALELSRRGGRARPEGVLWSLGPHALTIARLVSDATPRWTRVATQGASDALAEGELGDARLTLRLATGGAPVRRAVARGEAGELVLDELTAEPPRDPLAAELAAFLDAAAERDRSGSIPEEASARLDRALAVVSSLERAARLAELLPSPAASVAGRLTAAPAEPPTPSARFTPR